MKIHRNHVFQLFSLVTALAIIVASAQSTMAQKPWFDRIKKVYELKKEKNASCKLCHTYDKEKKESPDKDNINAFGKELKAVPEMKPLLGKDDDYKFTPADLDIVEAAVKSIESKDTDGDGATNGEELRLGTFPADDKSTPAKDELEKYRAEHKK